MRGEVWEFRFENSELRNYLCVQKNRKPGCIYCSKIMLNIFTINRIQPVLLGLQRSPFLGDLAATGDRDRWLTAWTGTDGPVFHGPVRSFFGLFPVLWTGPVNTSSNKPWSIDVNNHNQKLALHCIKLLNDTLHENICGLILSHPVKDEKLSEAVSYACKFWIDHICLVSQASESIGNQMYSFMCQHLLHWIEAQVILSNHNYTIRSLQSLWEWLLVRHLSSQFSHVTNHYCLEILARTHTSASACI
jgi:hypothetical protein